MAGMRVVAKEMVRSNQIPDIFRMWNQKDLLMVLMCNMREKDYKSKGFYLNNF